MLDHFPSTKAAEGEAEQQTRDARLKIVCENSAKFSINLHVLVTAVTKMCRFLEGFQLRVRGPQVHYLNVRGLGGTTRHPTKANGLYVVLQRVEVKDGAGVCPPHLQVFREHNLELQQH